MPVMLAFGPLVLTDIAITLFVVLTLWAFANMWQSPSRGTVLRFGLAFGGALLSKFSSGLLFFCFLAFILSLRWRPVPEQPADKAELQGVASFAMVEPGEGHLIGCAGRLCRLLCPLLE